MKFLQMFLRLLPVALCGWFAMMALAFVIGVPFLANGILVAVLLILWSVFFSWEVTR